MKPATSNIIAVISIFVLVVIICSFLHYVEENSKKKAQWTELLESTEISESVRNNKIVSIVVNSKSSILKKENDMLRYHYTLEFTVYKYDKEGISEILLGFWPKKELTLYKDVEEMIDVSMAIIYEYIQKDAGKSGFSVWFNNSEKNR